MWIGRWVRHAYASTFLVVAIVWNDLRRERSAKRTRAKAQAAGVAASAGRLRGWRWSTATGGKAGPPFAPGLALVSNQGHGNSWHKNSISLAGNVLGSPWSDFLSR